MVCLEKWENNSNLIALTLLLYFDKLLLVKRTRHIVVGLTRVIAILKGVFGLTSPF